MLGNLVPDPEALLALEPEELAGVLLQHLNSLGPEAREQLSRFNLVQAGSFPEYPSNYRERIAAAVMEAWVWLEREGLIAPKPGTTGEWRFITRRGERLSTAAEVDAYRRANLLPKNLLHPVIAQRVWAAFLRGDYDVAVFQAFKEVEVAVRKAGGFTDSDIGVSLVRKAFDKNSGPLTDKSVSEAEREALATFSQVPLALIRTLRATAPWPSKMPLRQLR